MPSRHEVPGCSRQATSAGRNIGDVADRVERITELLMMLLDAEQPITFEQILERSSLYGDRSEATRKSFERDKSLLRSLGVEIDTTIDRSNGVTRYRIRPDDYFLPDLDLSEAEQLSLQLAAAAVRLDEAWDEAALSKLGGTGETPPMVVAELPSLGELPAIHAAIRDRAPLHFVYGGRRRTVLGFGVFYRDGNWYLHGDDDGTAKTFRIDRVEGGVDRGDTRSYDLPDDFDSTDVMPRDPLLIGEGDAVVASVWVDRTLAARVVRLRGSAAVIDRRDDGSVVVEVPVRNRQAFRSWVLGMRDRAEVLSPPELRSEIASWLASIVAAR